mgnify:CR=1 FL=1
MVKVSTCLYFENEPPQEGKIVKVNANNFNVNMWCMYVFVGFRNTKQETGQGGKIGEHSHKSR